MYSYCLSFIVVIEKNLINFVSFFCLLWHTWNLFPMFLGHYIHSSALFLQIPIGAPLNLGRGLSGPGECLLPPVKPKVRIAPDKSGCRAPVAWRDIHVT